MNPKELLIEEEYLKKTIDEIQAQINVLKTGLDVEETSINEFNRYVFKEMGNMDSVEIRSNLLSSAMEEQAFLRKSKYLKKLYRIRSNPYFGRIDITSDRDYKIYLGITYLEKDNDHLIYDWRSPVANLFYDSEVGSCSYIAPEGQIDCILHKKRQYKITNGKIVNIFDNDLNINDDVLQQVLSNESSDKMKNIVNTIQKEQNNVIRNITNKNLIVEGIAGSGKTSVALHRIAYLLYKIPNLSSDNVLIFSPNNIFSIYISNVLPELGEDNTKETTFSAFSKDYIKEYKEIETFTDFISRYYTNKDINVSLIKFKQSDRIVKVIEDYVENLIKNTKFIDDLSYLEFKLDRNTLNYLFHDRYNMLNIIERLDKMAEYLCNLNGFSVGKHKRSILSKLYKIVNFKKDFKKLYFDFYMSDEFKKAYGNNLSQLEIKEFINVKTMYYEDSLLFIYLKGLIQGFPYSNLISEIVIDEAQDYSKLQYLILKKIFKRASFTILGDVNQTINPYYKYNSLNDLKDVLGDDTLYLSLTKTYRSSKEIIEFSNKILNLDYAVSIRKNNNKPVIVRNNIENEIDCLKNDIKYLQNLYKKTCIITKNNDECNKLYELLKDEFLISNMLSLEKLPNPNLVIVPSFLAKGLEFDSVIIYNEKNNYYLDSEKYLYYVAVTRSMHELIVYNN